MNKKKMFFCMVVALQVLPATVVAGGFDAWPKTLTNAFELVKRSFVALYGMMPELLNTHKGTGVYHEDSSEDEIDAVSNTEILKQLNMTRKSMEAQNEPNKVPGIKTSKCNTVPDKYMQALHSAIKDEDYGACVILLREYNFTSNPALKNAAMRIVAAARNKGLLLEEKNKNRDKNCIN